jgi:uncharacterized protein YoxC
MRPTENFLVYLGYGIAAVGAISVATIIIRSKSIRGQQDSADRTIKLLSDNVKALQDQTNILTVELNASKTDRDSLRQAVAHLEGQVASYKEIPLSKIATSLDKLAVSNDQILNTLKSSAVIAATDRNILTSIPSANQTVQEQTVEHQTIKRA